MEDCRPVIPVEPETTPASPATAPPASVTLRDERGETLGLVGDADDQLALAARLSPIGFRLSDRDRNDARANEKPLGTMLAVPDTTPPAVFRHAVLSLGASLPADHDLLHPVARAGWAGLPDTGRFAVTGYSGHGNMLLQAVLRAVGARRLGPDKHRQAPAWVQRLRDEADHHGHVLRCACVALFEELANERGTTLRDYTVAPGQLADATVRARFADGYTLVLAGVPYAGFVGGDFGAHTIWDDRAARFFSRYGYGRVYAVVRNPLAGLASNAAKTVRPLERALHDRDWFLQAAKETARYLAALERQRDHFRLVRFEDLIHHPLPTIQTLAQHAGAELNEADAEAVWDEVGFKPVTEAGAEHLVDPRSDKRRHFRREHLDLIREAGLAVWFERFRYRLPEPGDLPDGLLDPEHANAAGVEPAQPSTLYGRLDPTRTTRVPLPEHHAEVRATDPALAERAAAAVADEGFRRIRRTLGDAFTEGVPCTPELVS